MLAILMIWGWLGVGMLAPCIFWLETLTFDLLRHKLHAIAVMLVVLGLGAMAGLFAFGIYSQTSSVYATIDRLHTLKAFVSLGLFVGVVTGIAVRWSRFRT